jgi:capsular polysaccharide export protein
MGRVNLRLDNRIYSVTILLFSYLWACSIWGQDNSAIDIVILLKRLLYVLCLLTAPLLVIKRFPKFFDLLLYLVVSVSFISATLLVFQHIEAYGSQSLSRRMTGWGHGFNSIGLALHHGIAVTIAICLTRAKKMKAVWGCLACTTPFAVLILTNSRGPMVALLCSCVLIFFLFEKSRATALKNSAIFAVIAGGLCIAGWFWLSSRGYSGRIDIWQQTWSQISQHPIFGMGYSLYGNTIDYKNTTLTHSHNVILELWRYAGLISVLLFLYQLVTLYHSRTSNENPINNTYLIIFVFNFLVMLTSGWFILDRPNYFWLGYWYPLGYLIARQVTSCSSKKTASNRFNYTGIDGLNCEASNMTKKIVFITGRGKKQYFGMLSRFIEGASLLEKKNLPQTSLFLLFSSLKNLNKMDLIYICEYFLKLKSNKYRTEHPIFWMLYRRFIYLRAVIYYSRYRYYLMTCQADWVGIWGGCYHDDRAAEVAAHQLGKKVVFFEGGLLPNTTTVDDRGINFRNSVPRDRCFYSEYAGSSKISIPQSLVPRPSIKNQTSNPVSLPEKFIFVPFQVESDSQIILYGDWIDSMRTLFSVIQSVSDAMPSDLVFVFKEHPSSRATYDDLGHKLTNRTLFANGNSTEELIKKAEAIVTINSTVGVESLMLGKRVITLGKAFYAIPGLTKQAHTKDELHTLLNNLNGWTIDHNFVRNFITYLREEYLVSGSWNTANGPHIKLMSDKLASMMG